MTVCTDANHYTLNNILNPVPPTMVHDYSFVFDRVHYSVRVCTLCGTKALLTYDTIIDNLWLKNTRLAESLMGYIDGYITKKELQQVIQRMHP